VDGKLFFSSLLDAETAKKGKEFLYINFWDRTREPLTAAELDDYQVAHMRLAGPVTVSHKDTVQRTDSVTRLRIAEVKRYKCLEVTGFLEFNDVIFYAVLLTPHETQRSNIRRLETVLRQALPMKVSYDHTESIQKARAQLKETNTASERALLLRKIGRHHRAMDHFSEARLALEESLSIDPENAYWIINELVPVLVKLNDRIRIKELMARMLRLDPHNPTVFNDCFSLGSGWLERDELLGLIKELKNEFRFDEFVQANCDFYSGNLLAQGNRALARQKFIAARRIFRRILPAESEVFKVIRIMLKQCS
jgi:tetratricopeptide (TPR) repeat protein